MPHAVVIALIAFLVSAAAVAWLARGHASQLALDQPNARSLHTTPVPRSGGIGLLAGISAAWLIISPQLPWPYWLALGLVIVVSLVDDIRGLHVAVRLGTHLFAAALAVFSLLPPGENMLLSVAIILATGWMCNLYNFMDGSDGLAGGMASFGFGAFAIAAWLSGSTQFALLNMAIAMASGGFLLQNFHPARIFMGDAGSITLGFLAATLGLVGWQQSDWTWWFPVLVFSPFIADASLTLARRTLARARIWEAHRDHYYQRLVQLGLGHRSTALAEYVLMSGCAITAIWSLTQQATIQCLILAAFFVLYLVLATGISRAWKQRNNHAS